MAVGGGNVRVAVQAQDADGQTSQRRHDAGRVSGPDQRFVLLVGDVADPVELVLDVPVAADPGGQGLRARAAVAGDQAGDLDGLPALPDDRAAQLGDLRGAVEPDPGRRERHLDRAASAPAVVLDHGRDGRDTGSRQLPELPVQGGHVGLDGHHAAGALAEDDLRRVRLRVHRVLCRHLRYADLRRDMVAVCL
jgi:hypothetical protein